VPDKLSKLYKWEDDELQNLMISKMKLKKSTPTVTILERSQVEIEQFLEMLRFETRSKLEELPGIPK
jgi:hypothetical protein